MSSRDTSRRVAELRPGDRFSTFGLGVFTVEIVLLVGRASALIFCIEDPGEPCFALPRRALVRVER